MIARRYLLPGKGEGFIFLVAAISLFAVALGVAALIIVMSVMNGFRAELFDKIVGLNGHAIVQGYDGRLANWQQIADTARKTPGRDLGHAADRAAADGLGQRPRRRRAGARNAARGPSRQPGHQQQCHGRRASLRSRRAAATSRSARASPRRSAPIVGSEISLISPEGRSTAVGTVPRDRRPTPSARSSRSASTITTRRSSSCRCRTRRRC